MLKIIFFGTGEFAEPIFEKLTQEKDLAITALVTAPDKPIGRRQILTPPKIKAIAQKEQISVLQPDHPKSADFLAQIRQLSPDLIIVASYGKILPDELLAIPRYQGINIHPSLLPKYRGASPIQFALLNQEKETGVSIIQITDQVDAGAIISQEKLIIQPNDDYLILRNKLAQLAAKMIKPATKKWVKIQAGQIKNGLIIQDEDQSTATKILTKQDGQINWQKPAQEIAAQIKALNPWPGTWTTWQGKILKIIRAGQIIEPNEQKEIGEIVKLNNSFGIQTGQGILAIIQIQPSGKKPMPSQDFLRGHQNFPGAILK